MKPRPENARRRRSINEALELLQDATGETEFTISRRIQVARAYRVLGDCTSAASWYRSAVDQLSARGEAVKALALAKELSEVMPGEQRTFTNLADRFSKARVDPDARVAVPLNWTRQPTAAPERILDASELVKVHAAESLGAGLRPLPAGTDLPSLAPPIALTAVKKRGALRPSGSPGRSSPAAEPVLLDEPELLDERSGPPAADRNTKARQQLDTERVISALSRLPLLGELDRAAFVKLARAARLRIVESRGFVFREGEQAESFYLLAEGDLEVVRRKGRREVVLRRVAPNQAFGMFALATGQKHAAGVRALGAATILELPADGLAEVLDAYPKARLALSRFYQERLLESFLAFTPLFDELDPEARGQLIGRFREKELEKGDRLVSPGELFDGLFLPLSGRLLMTRRLGTGKEQTLATFDPGGFVGVVAALADRPCRCSITAAEPTRIALLPQRQFNDFVKEHSLLRQLPERLTETDLLVAQDVFVIEGEVPETP